MRGDILTTADCGACDAHAVAHGVPGITLMNAAGAAVAHAVMQRWACRPVLVFCGPGNNGGDGFIAAQALSAAGWPVRVCLLADTARLVGDAAWARDQWTGRVESWDPALLEQAGLVIDGVFGAGLTRPLDGDAAEIVAALDGFDGPVVAIDIPSGWRGDHESAPELAVTADLTVTFNNLKPVHVLEPGASACGEVEMADIGIPVSWRNEISCLAQLNRPDLWWPAYPHRAADTHKHREGRLVVFSGGARSTGAARLAARAGLRIGAGLVTLASPPAALQINAAMSTAVMLARWETASDASTVLEKCRASACVIGPALGVDDKGAEAVASVLDSAVPTVFDADALTVMSQAHAACLGRLDARHVLTPHAGEFERLFPGWLERGPNKIEVVRAAAREVGCTILLKGADSVIAAPDGACVVNRHASPVLATAGSGDVLAGLIAGLMAQGVDAFRATCAACWLHGDVALNAGAGLIAEDLADALPARLTALQTRQRSRLSLQSLLQRRE